MATVGVSLELEADIASAMNAGWITREDAALKRRLQGVRVQAAVERRQADPGGELDPDKDDGQLEVIDSKWRTVPVFFRLPENEVRRKTYPYIVIDFLAPVRLVEEEHRGVGTYGQTANAYRPAGMPAAGGRIELPIPFQLQYQVTTYARYAQHDRAINVQLMTSRLEPRFGYLEMGPTDEAPDDLSVRRLDLLSGPTNGDTRDSEGRRLFRKMYTVGVSSELFLSEFAGLAATREVNLDLHEIE